jgi:hypothetical protein
VSAEKNQIHREALFTSNQSSTEGPGRKLNPPKAQATSGISTLANVLCHAADFSRNGVQIV